MGRAKSHHFQGAKRELFSKGWHRSDRERLIIFLMSMGFLVLGAIYLHLVDPKPGYACGEGKIEKLSGTSRHARIECVPG